MLVMASVAHHPGPAVRRLRRYQGLKQSAMARRLGISASYLNLIEHGQRPLPAPLEQRLAEEFGYDPASPREDAQLGGVGGLLARLADSRFADLGLGPDAVTDWLAAAPQTALAFARLYDQMVTGAERPEQQVEREIARQHNHFAALDRAAERLATALAASGPDLSAALVARLEGDWGLTAVIVAAASLEGAVRRIEPDRRQVLLSDALDPAARQFQLAEVLAIHACRAEIAAAANGADMADRDAWRMLRRHLISYAAAALVMPYGRFLRECTATGYDFGRLQRRFGVSFSQLAHRLTTLGRERQRGLPFFMLRIDRTGQIGKRLAGRSGSGLLLGEGSCPLWQWHAAFAAADGGIVQQVELAEPAGHSRWWTLARRVGERVVVLAVEAEAAHAVAQIAAARMLPEAAIGTGCSCCPRACAHRSRPESGRKLRFDERERPTFPWLAL